MLGHFELTQYRRVMSAGRNKPALCVGTAPGGQEVEFVVKFHRCVEHLHTGLAFEAIGSQLAAYFGMATPEAAMVHLGPGLADHLPPGSPPCIAESAGANFGSGYLRGLSTFPSSMALTAASMASALRVFAFDALIQNPDRRQGNPNLLVRGDEFVVYDHELAFSFAYAIGQGAEPWRLEDQNWLGDHVFLTQLRGTQVDLQGFTEKLAGLSDNELGAMLSHLPAEWQNETVARVAPHLLAVAAHAPEFAASISRRLQ